MNDERKPFHKTKGGMALLIFLGLAGLGALFGDPPADDPAPVAVVSESEAPAEGVTEGGGGESDAPEVVEPTEPEVDAATSQTCSHYFNVQRDVADGVLTDAELREKIQEVELTASISDAPGLAEAARQLLAAVTRGDVNAYAEASGVVSGICADAV